MFQSQPEIIQGIPEDQWIHKDLMDIARMTDKQRHAYWVTVSTAQARLLMTKGNCVGEKPDRPLNIDKMVAEHEASHQRAMAYQREVVEQNERAAQVSNPESVGRVSGLESTKPNSQPINPNRHRVHPY